MKLGLVIGRVVQVVVMLSYTELHLLTLHALSFLAGTSADLRTGEKGQDNQEGRLKLSKVLPKAKRLFHCRLFSHSAAP